jgi:hypothetical protein
VRLASSASREGQSHLRLFQLEDPDNDERNQRHDQQEETRVLPPGSDGSTTDAGIRSIASR